MLEGARIDRCLCHAPRMLRPISAQMRAESGAHVMMTSGVRRGVLQALPIGTKVVFTAPAWASVGCGVLKSTSLAV